MDNKNSKSNNRNGKGRNRNNKGRSNVDRRTNDRSWNQEKGSRTNDISWYTAFPEISDAAKHIPFTYATGAPFIGNYDVKAGFHIGSIPGIMTMEYFPNFGQDLTPDSAVNIAARQMYAEIRKSKSGTSYYEQSDLMVYILAVTELMSSMAELRRVMGCFMITNPQNKYFAKHIVEALGFDYDDLSEHLANLRTYYNLTAKRLEYFVLPGILNFSKRRIWMNTSIFADSDSIKAQMYAFIPSGYWKYSDTASETGSMLWYAPRVTNNTTRLLTYADIRTWIDSMMIPLIGSESMSKISADVLYVYNGNTVSIPFITSDYVTVPTYSAEVLSQIENATLVPRDYMDGVSTSDVPSTANQALIQNQSNLVSGPYLTYKTKIGMNGAGAIKIEPYSMTFLNLHEAPGDDKSLIASRMACCFDKDTVVAHGTEILTNWVMHVIQYDPETEHSTIVKRYSAQEFNYWSPTTMNYNRLEALQAYMCFDWAPKLILWFATNSEDVSTYKPYVCCDYANVGLMDYSTLYNLNEAAMLSLFSTR